MERKYRQLPDLQRASCALCGIMRSCHVSKVWLIGNFPMHGGYFGVQPEIFGNSWRDIPFIQGMPRSSIPSFSDANPHLHLHARFFRYVSLHATIDFLLSSEPELVQLSLGGDGPTRLSLASTIFHITTDDRTGDGNLDVRAVHMAAKLASHPRSHLSPVFTLNHAQDRRP